METDGEVISSVRDVGTAESYYFYNKDLQGSTTNVLNAIGQSEVAYEYTDFGETETKGNEDFYNEIAYTGEIYDDTTGLYYLNSRYYNPEDGRFITEDTYAGEYSEPSSLHLYVYCQNNPVNNTDPTGNFPWALVSAAWDAYDGYQIAKKKKLTGAKKVAYIAGYVAVNSINPFKAVKKVVKCVKAVKKVRRVAKTYKRYKKAKVVYKKAKKIAKATYRKSKKVVRKSTKKVYKGYLKTKCKVTKKGCFVEGTLVLTENGLIPIEDIEVGDYVWAENPETGEIELKEVLNTFEKQVDTIVTITVDGENIETTEAHLFYVENTGWVPASMLKEGDILSLEDGREVPIESIETITYNHYINVYNFEVDDFHTYYVSNISVLTHNQTPCQKLKRWEVGDPIDQKTSKGNDPTWSTVKSRYWKNQADKYKGTRKYSKANLDRMRRGLAPKKLNKKTGQVEIYHLHHKVYRCRGGSNAESNLVRMFRSNHIAYHKKHGYK